MNGESRSPSIFGIAVRDANRLRSVLKVVVAHGFGEFVARVPLAAQILGPITRKPKGAIVEGTPAERFARLLSALGPTFIKLGQVLSMRADLFSREYVEALSSLQDRAPPFAFANVVSSIELGLGRSLSELFEHVDEEPLATASIGQTHRALTRDGRRVVIKVQRPGIEEVMRGDLDLLYLAARALEASIDEMRWLAPASIVMEFERSILEELDFRAELSNLHRMQLLLDPARTICVPRPVDELSSRTVLTMDFFDGKPVRALVPGSERARRVVSEILHAMCKGVFVDGFFHGDPHSGNILVSDDDQICFLDLGLVGRLSPEQRDHLVTIVLATLLDDASTVARVLLTMGTPTQRVELSELKSEIGRIRNKYIEVRSIEEVDTRNVIEDFVNAAARFRIKLASEYSVLAKSLGTLEGLVRTLAPAIDPTPIVRPYVERVFGERWSGERMLQQALGGATGMVSLARALPNHADQILHDMQTGNVRVRPIMPQLERLPDRVHDGASRIAVAIFAASMTITMALVVPEHDYERPIDAVKIAVFAIATICAALGWTIAWWWHWLGRGTPLRLLPIVRLFRRSGR